MSSPGRFIERGIVDRVEDALIRQAAVALIGPRQVGKTTVALQIAARRDALYLDLENESDRARLDDPHLLLEANKHRLVILDEVHRAPGLFPELRGIIDRGRLGGSGTADSWSWARRHSTCCDNRASPWRGASRSST